MASALFARLEPFDCRNGDFDYYLEQFDHFLVLNSIDEESKKVPLLISSIGQDAYKILKQICDPVDPKERSFDQLKVQLQEYFSRRDFYARNQRQGEYPGAYVNELKRLSLKCNFGPFAKEALRDRIACGKIPEDKVDKKPTKPAVEVTSEAKPKQKKPPAPKAEDKWVMLGDELQVPKQRKPKGPQGQPVSVGQELGKLLLDEAKRLMLGPNSAPQQQPQKQHKCKICGHAHRESECAHKDASCFLCRKKGHIASVCRDKGNKGKQEQQHQQPVQVHVHVQQNTAMQK